MNHQIQRKIVLVIVDGFGIGPEDNTNAIYLANTPNWSKMLSKYPWTPLSASGNEVGLPADVMGNSEVGHLTLGTGRITYQSLERINRAIREDRLRDLNTMSDLIGHLQNSGGNLHLLGLLSDGKVHSDFEHFVAVIEILAPEVKKIKIHAFTDGRDTPVDSGLAYLQNLRETCEKFENCNLASIVGRYYGMDRDKKWDRTKIAYDLLIHGVGEKTSNVFSLIQDRYDNGETDEFLRPIIIDQEGLIRENDAVLFLNFRPDRARQITRAINFGTEFDTVKFENLFFACMTRYEAKWNLPVLFDNIVIKNSIAEVLSKHSVPQLHIAETEKYAHVTYFLNGGFEDPFPHETRILVPSSKVATYDLQPEMSTPQITEKTLDALQNGQFSFIIINIAAPDMVGHTGNMEATIAAVEATDTALEKIYEETKKRGYVMIVTADHGNAEKMKDGMSIHTAHTTNPVPFLITMDGIRLNNSGGLKNVAPTILQIMGIPKPEDMTAESLIINSD